jgi:hypothetical protein
MRKRNWSRVPDDGMISGQTGRLAVIHKDNLTLTLTMVSSQPQCTETCELENLINKLLSSSGHLCDATLFALFQLSGIMSHTCSYGMVLVIPSCYQAFYFFKIGKVG